MLTLPTSLHYADWLTRTLRDAADQQAAALYQARLRDAEPLPVTVTRHQCPHCRRTWAKRAGAAAHIARCWHNPAAKGCKTCRHFIPESEGPYPQHPPFPEECEAGETGVIPRIDCQLWTALNEA